MTNLLLFDSSIQQTDIDHGSSDAGGKEAPSDGHAISVDSQRLAESSKGEILGLPKRLHISNIPFRFREPDIRQLFGVSITQSVRKPG